MENIRPIIFIPIALAMLTPAWLFAYEPNSTHDVLTHEAVNFYNTFAGEYGTPQISDVGRASIQKGAMEEDDDYRMAHHFYDPVHKNGLKGYISSKVWAQSPEYQGAWKNGPAGCIPRPHALFPLYESPCDYSWQRAIYDYAYGDEVMKGRALEALGHTLHLIEDASVPDHTRDDAHIPIFDQTIRQYDEGFAQKSPFEGFADQFSVANGNVRTKDELLREGAVPYKIFTLDEYFDNTAVYSNSNFFSKSTIFDEDYSLPVNQSTTTKEINGNIITLGNYNGHSLVRIIIEKDETTLKDSFVYDLKTPQDYILKEYWQLTSRDAVKNASGVIRLFFEEVEKEKRTHVLRDRKSPTLQQASTKVVRIAFGGIEAVAHYASRAVTNTLLAINFYGSDMRNVALPIAQKIEETVSPPVVAVEKILTEMQKPIVTTVGVSERIISADFSLLISRLLEARRVLEGMAMASTINPALISNNQGEVAGASTTASLALLPVSGSGIVSPPDPRIDYGFPQGSTMPSTNLEVEPPNVASTTGTADEEVVASTTEEVVPDTTPPAAPTIMNFQGVALAGQDTFDIATTSIALDGSAEASSTVTLLLVEESTTTAHFFDVQADTLWSFHLLLSEGTSTLLLTATDEAGNVSSSTMLVVTVLLPVPPPPPPPPDPIAPFIRISEVAWAGTYASGADEWIEIHNRTDDTLSLDGLTLRTADGGLSIPLSGNIAPQGYYVISSGADVFIDPLSLWMPDMVASFGDGIDNGGEELQLVHTVDNSIVDYIPYCLDWCEKGSVIGTTMMLEYFEDPAFNWDYWGSGFQYSDIRDRNFDFIRGLPGVGTENLVPV